MDWLRQHPRVTSRAMHTATSARLSLSEAPERARSPHGSFPLLACHERQQHGRLTQVAQAHVGVRIALDGLAPQGGAPHMGCIRALSTGLTLRRGWLAQPMADLAGAEHPA